MKQTKILIHEKYEIIIDARDAKWINSLKMTVNDSKCATGTNVASKRYASIMHSYDDRERLHRAIYERHIGKIGKDMVIHHINGNPLDNRIVNLEQVTKAVNNLGRVKTISSTSSVYKGVHFNKRASKWEAAAHLNRKRYGCGTYKDEWEAAEAYNEKAQELFGKYAVLNTYIKGRGKK